MKFLENMLAGSFSFAIIGFYLAMFVGSIYWLWMAIQLGSFLMFFLAFIPPLFLVSGPVGAWSFLFGVPDWVLNWFA